MLFTRLNLARMTKFPTSLWLKSLALLLSIGSVITGDAQGQLALKAQAAFQRQLVGVKSEKASRTPAQLKMDSQLVYAIREKRNGLAIAEAPNLRAQVKFDAHNKILVDIEGHITPELLTLVDALGGKVVNSHPESNALRTSMTLPALETLAARPEVKFIQPAIVPETNAATGQGPRTHVADYVSTNINVLGGSTKANGTGIKVGVISDSNDFMEQAQAAGDLPANITTLPGQSGRPATGEGSAMMEIVSEMAPGAQLYYATGKVGGTAQFAANIRALKAAGCRIIVDDVTYPNESPFQDDVIIAKAVLEVSGQGVLYFSSAANSGNKNDGTSGTWEGDFSPLGSVLGSPIQQLGRQLVQQGHDRRTGTRESVLGRSSGRFQQ